METTRRRPVAVRMLHVSEYFGKAVAVVVVEWRRRGCRRRP